MTTAIYLNPLRPDTIRACLRAWRDEYPECGVLALLPEQEKDRLAELQAVSRELSVPLVGGIFPALVADADFVTDGAWLLRLDHMPAHGLIPDLGVSADEATERIAETVAAELNADRVTLFMLFDAMLPNIASILDGLYLRLADRVRYVGVNAGSETFRPMPCLFDRDRVLENALLWLSLPDDRGVVLEHGYQAPERMLIASSTEGNRIFGIDWRPAFEVYQERMREEYGVELTRETFYRYATHFPFGILRADGEIIVRIPVALEEDGSLFCVGEIPPNSVLCLLQAPAAGSSHTVDRVVRGLGDLHSSMAGRELLTFYCAGRRMHLGAAAQSELSDLRDKTGAGCMAGALSLGEIGNSRAWGYPLFHNAAFVCSAWDAQ